MRLPVTGAQFTATLVHVETVTDRYGDTVTTEARTSIEGCLHAPARPSEQDHRVTIPATIYLPDSHTVDADDHFLYPDGSKWEVLGGGADWQVGTAVQIQRWGVS